MIKSKLAIFISHICLFLLIPSLSSATYTHLLWERSISNALNERDDYYQKVGITHDEATFNILWTQKGRYVLQEQLELHMDPNSPWYHFLLGIVNSNTSIDDAVESFNAALRCAESKPGDTWVLFYEFRQAKQEEWADKCLRNLEKEFILISAQSVPVISQQLLAIARQEHLNGNRENAEKYIAWSIRFERYPFWQTLYKGLFSLPKKPMVFIQACFECVAIVKSSWLLQATLLYYVYQWLRFICIAFIGIVLLTLSLEILPVAIHPCIELFPAGITARLKYLLCVALLISLAAFGFVPFFLLVTLLLWYHVKNQKKVLLAICLFLIIFSPVDARFQEMFRVSLSPNKSLGLFRRTISEGWHIDLEKRVQENLLKNSEDYLACASAAILDMKKNDTHSAIKNIQKAEALNQNDPIILITAGNIYFSAGEEQKALQYYKKCVEQFPLYVIGLFNLGQLNLNLMNTTEGTQQLVKAAELDPELVNTFIEKNADFFSNTWPRLRQFMQPDYTVSYFWKKVFLHYTGSWKSTTTLWGSTLFGIPPLFFLYIGLLLFILLLTIKISSPIENIFFCKLCGNPMCRRCRIGPLCTDCIQATDNAHSESLNKHVKKLISRRKRLILIITRAILKGIFPGTDTIYKKKTIPVTGFVFLILTCFIYGLYCALFTFTFSYPFWVVQRLFTVLFCLLLVYSCIFIIRALRDLVKKLTSMEGIHGA